MNPLRKAAGITAGAAIFFSITTAPWTAGPTYRAINAAVEPIIQHVSTFETERAQYQRLLAELERNDVSVERECLEDKILLEDTIPPPEDPADLWLSEWEITTIERLVPIVSTIEDAAHEYCLDPRLSLQAMILESSLMPLAKSATIDYGLGQLRASAFETFYEFALDPENPFHDAAIEEGHGIYHPETNIRLFHLAQAFNREVTGVEDQNALYAIYSRGDRTIIGGTESQKALGQEMMERLEDRRGDIERWLGLLGSEERYSQLPDAYARELFAIGERAEDPAHGYELVLDHIMGYFSRRPESRTATWNDALRYHNAAEFAGILELEYGRTMRDEREQLVDVGERLLETLPREPGVFETISESHETLLTTETAGMIPRRYEP